MISLSLRNRRITRWNIRQTATTKLIQATGPALVLCAAMCCPSLFCPTLAAQAAADNILPPVVPEPVDVTLPAANLSQLNNPQDVSGRISLDVLATKPATTDENNTKTPETAESDAAAANARQQSRDLMNALRSGRTLVTPTPAATPVANAKPAATSTEKLSTLQYVETDGMRMNSILLTGGDEEAGTIKLPEVSGSEPVLTIDGSTILPELPATSGNPQYYNNGYSKQDLRRAKRAANGGGKFIEFYDPELEHFDAGDYERSVLLVGSQDEVEDNNREASELLSRKLTDIKPTLSYAWGDLEKKSLPDDFHKRMDNGEYTETPAPRTVLQWEPTNIWYHPLYFEDVGLERYGHTRKPWVQPFVSTGKFFGQVAMLPYQMTLHPPKAKEFALGHYQPGEWAPKKRYQVPFNEEATTVELLWITGLILLIP
ncbi:MAG: hypothetical protein WBH50_23750 [Fuerstiella sp.]